MITSSSIPFITQVLNEPGSLNEASLESIIALREAFPYFLPAHYMEAASIHRQKPFAPSIMNTMPLYMGNWLLYNYFLQAALGAEYTPQATTEHEKREPAPEENFETEPTYITAEEVHETLVPVEEDDEEEQIDFNREPVVVTAENDDTLILPIYTEDYFFHQGMQVSNDIPTEIDKADKENADEDKSLMVVMSFSEWLLHFKTSTEKEKEEKEDQRALKTMWQKEKLAAAMEEENDEIPESVFEMAVNSITQEEDLVSEPLAEIHIKQGKYDKAIDMYRKLSLKNPQKNAYFARKIEAILKEKQS